MFWVLDSKDGENGIDCFIRQAWTNKNVSVITRSSQKVRILLWYTVLSVNYFKYHYHLTLHRLFTARALPTTFPPSDNIHAMVTKTFHPLFHATWFIKLTSLFPRSKTITNYPSTFLVHCLHLQLSSPCHRENIPIVATMIKPETTRNDANVHNCSFLLNHSHRYKLSMSVNLYHGIVAATTRT